eukprot:384655-Pyramimonas_sp.AAC.1
MAGWSDPGFVRAQQLHVFAGLKSQDWCSDTIQVRQNATVRLARGVEVLRMRHALGFSHNCPPTEQFPQGA